MTEVLAHLGRVDPGELGHAHDHLGLLHRGDVDQPAVELDRAEAFLLGLLHGLEAGSHGRHGLAVGVAPQPRHHGLVGDADPQHEAPARQLRQRLALSTQGAAAGAGVFEGGDGVTLEPVGDKRLSLEEGFRVRREADGAHLWSMKRMARIVAS